MTGQSYPSFGAAAGAAMADNARIAADLAVARAAEQATDEAAVALAPLVTKARKAQAQHDTEVRAAALREGAAALQAVIDRDRAQFPHSRGQSRIALGGARQILLDLAGQDTTPTAPAAKQPTADLPPTLAALRDLIAADPGAMTITEAEESARTFLAAHAHELAGLVQNAILADRDRAPGGGALGPRNHARRGGMLTARQVLDRYADQLDQTAGGEQA